MKKIIISLLLLLCAFFLSGCQATLHNTLNQTTPLPEELEEHVVSQSDQLADYVKSMPYVHHATATIIGSSALIGIDLDDNFPDEKIPSVKREIRDQVLLFDSGLQRATVTITPHLFDRAMGIGRKSSPKEQPISDKLEENAVPASPTI